MSDEPSEKSKSKSDDSTKPSLLAVVSIISGLLGTGFGAALQGYFNVQLERQKFEYALIQKALDTTDKGKAADELLFLVDTGIIKSLNSAEIRKKANDPAKLPTLSVSQLTDKGCNASQLVREIDRQILFIMQANNPNSLVSFLDINNVKVSGNASFPLLQLSARKALEKAVKKRGTTLKVNQAYKSIVSQYLYYSYFEQGKCGILTAAPPGQSNHQRGLAIDIEDPLGWRPYLEAEGWRAFGSGDPPHFDFVGSGVSDVSKLSIEAFQKLWNLNYPNDKIPENGIYDSETKKRLELAPSNGFPKGDKCSSKCGFRSP